MPAATTRQASDDDAGAICAIYNATVGTTTVAWTEARESVDTRRAWLEEHVHAGNPVLVAEVDGRVAGFAAYDDFRNSVKWPGYRFTVEHTIHIDEDHQGGGIGSALLETLVAQAVAAGKHSMIGAIDGSNEGSIRFHQRHGFLAVARIPEAGIKFGRWLDLVLVQRLLA